MSMRPKNPIRPKIPGPSIEGAPTTRDLVPDYLPTRPGHLPGQGTEPIPGTR